MPFTNAFLTDSSTSQPQPSLTRASVLSAINRFVSTLPCVHRPLNSSATTPALPGSSDSQIHPMLLGVECTIHTALIILYRQTGHDDPAKARASARTMADSARSVDKVSPSYAHISLAVRQGFFFAILGLRAYALHWITASVVCCC